MADIQERESDPLAELTEADHRWWQRHSRHGEFPWSTLTSIGLHLFILLVLAVAAAPLLQQDRTPPSVDVLVVGDEADAAPDMGDGLPSEGGLEDSAAEEDMPQDVPEPMDEPELEDAPEPEPFDPNMPVHERGREIKDQQKQLDDARKRLSDVRKKLDEDLRKGKSGTGSGGGGGSGASGKAARAARWILRFNTSGAQNYLTQIDGIGANIAFPTSNNQYTYYYNASMPSRRSETRGLGADEMVYWIDDRPDSVGRVTAFLGIPSAPFMLSFLPKELEERMAGLERAYDGLEEDQISSTVFEVVHRGGKYDVFVVSQTPK